MSDEEKYLTITDIAKELNVVRYFVISWVTSGRLQAERSNEGGKRKKYIVKETVFRDFIANNEDIREIVTQNELVAAENDELINIDQISQKYNMSMGVIKNIIILKNDLKPIGDRYDRTTSYARYRKSEVDKIINDYKLKTMQIKEPTSIIDKLKLGDENYQSPDPDKLTITQIAKELNIPKFVVAGWVVNKLIDSEVVEPGKTIYTIKRNDLNDFIEKSDTFKEIVKENKEAELGGYKLITLEDISNKYIMPIKRVKHILQDNKISPINSNSNAESVLARYKVSDIEPLFTPIAKENINKIKESRNIEKVNDDMKPVKINGKNFKNIFEYVKYLEDENQKLRKVVKRLSKLI